MHTCMWPRIIIKHRCVHVCMYVCMQAPEDGPIPEDLRLTCHACRHDMCASCNVPWHKGKVRAGSSFTSITMQAAARRASHYRVNSRHTCMLGAAGSCLAGCRWVLCTLLADEQIDTKTLRLPLQTVIIQIKLHILFSVAALHAYIIAAPHHPTACRPVHTVPPSASFSCLCNADMRSVPCIAGASCGR